MRVLVTGATGFLGRQLVPRLSRAGCTVTTHGRSPATPFGAELEHVCGDLARLGEASAALSPWRWDYVVNLAGPVTGGAEDWTTGTDVVLAHTQIALHLRRFAPSGWAGRIVHASSMTVYGIPVTVPIREDHPRHPMHLYGLAKAVAEDVLLSDPQLSVCILRLPGLFSEERRSGALFHFMRAARAGDPVRITTHSPTPWDVLHVGDAADAIVAATRSDLARQEVINVSHGEPIELASVARWIVEHAGSRSTVETIPSVVHPVFQMDTAAARRLLGWVPPSLSERLASLYSLYSEAS